MPGDRDPFAFDNTAQQCRRVGFRFEDDNPFQGERPKPG